MLLLCWSRGVQSHDQPRPNQEQAALPGDQRDQLRDDKGLVNDKLRTRAPPDHAERRAAGVGAALGEILIFTFATGVLSFSRAFGVDSFARPARPGGLRGARGRLAIRNL
jgi:hypothetical protein